MRYVGVVGWSASAVAWAGIGVGVVLDAYEMTTLNQITGAFAVAYLSVRMAWGLWHPDREDNA